MIGQLSRTQQRVSVNIVTEKDIPWKANGMIKMLGILPKSFSLACDIYCVFEFFITQTTASARFKET